MRRFAIDIKATRKFAPEILKHMLVVAAVGLLLLAGTYAGFVMYGRLDSSLVDGIANPARYWALALGIAFAFHLPYYVAVGMTRRSFTSAGLTTMVLVAMVLATLFTVLYYLEMVFYRSLGWTQSMEPYHLFSGAGQAPVVFVEHLMVFITHGFAGWALAMAFYRLKAWGLVSIPVVIVALAGGDALTGIGWPGRALGEAGWSPPNPEIWAVPVLAAVAAGVAWAVWRMARDVAIATKPRLAVRVVARRWSTPHRGSFHRATRAR